MSKKKKLRGKNQKKVMKLLTYRVEISLRCIASEVLGTPMYTDTQYNSIRKTVNQLQNDKKLIESKTVPLFSKYIWDAKNHFPRGIPSHLRMVRVKCPAEWYCKDGIRFVGYGKQIPEERNCKI
jgi:hypothetical protein